MDEKEGADKMNALAHERKYVSITEAIKESLTEVKLIREGKITAKNWDEYLREHKQKKHK